MDDHRRTEGNLEALLIGTRVRRLSEEAQARLSLGTCARAPSGSTPGPALIFGVIKVILKSMKHPQFLRTTRPPTSAVQHRIEAAPLGTKMVGQRMAELFGRATAQAVEEACAEGLAVPGRIAGEAVERRPDGATCPIDAKAAWSPTAWQEQDVGTR